MAFIQSNRKSPLLHSLNNNGSNVNPFDYYYSNNIQNGQKDIIIIRPQPGPNSIYNKRFIFDIPKNGLFAQAFIKWTLTTAGDNTEVEDRLGVRVADVIRLETRRGPDILQTLDQLYTNARIDNLSYNLFTQIGQMTEPDIVFNANTVICWCPLFLWSSERPQMFLDTEFLEPLQITAITAATKEQMGLPSDLTAVSCELHLTYFKMASKIKRGPKTLLTYDAFIEPVQIITGSSATVNIECNKCVFNMHLFITSTTQEQHRIESFKFKSGNKVLIDLSRRTNFNLWSQEEYNNITGAFTYWFSLNKSRTSNQISLDLDGLQEKTLELSFDTLPVDTVYRLHVIFEYWNLTSINNYGLVNRNLVH